MSDRPAPVDDADRAAADPAAGTDSGAGNGHTQDPPRLGPRPLDRPAVDAGVAATFGRPDGVAGGFARPAGSATPTAGTRRTGPPPTALSSAFGRPDTAAPSLQRPPGRRPAEDPDPVFWDSLRRAGPVARTRTPPVALGPPPAGGGDTAAAARGEGARLSVRELLFGRRVQPRALPRSGWSRCWSGRPAGWSAG